MEQQQRDLEELREDIFQLWLHNSRDKHEEMFFVAGVSMILISFLFRIVK